MYIVSYFMCINSCAYYDCVLLCIVCCVVRKLYHQLMEEILYNPHTMEDAGDMVDHVSHHYIIACRVKQHACNNADLATTGTCAFTVCVAAEP